MVILWPWGKYIKMQVTVKQCKTIVPQYVSQLQLAVPHLPPDSAERPVFASSSDESWCKGEGLPVPIRSKPEKHRGVARYIVQMKQIKIYSKIHWRSYKWSFIAIQRPKISQNCYLCSLAASTICDVQTSVSSIARRRLHDQRRCHGSRDQHARPETSDGKAAETWNMPMK